MQFEHKSELPGKAVLDIGYQNQPEPTTLEMYRYNEETNQYEYLEDVLAIRDSVLVPVSYGDTYVIKEKKLKYGDVNNDGYIDTEDARMIFKYYIGAITLTEEQMKIADVNKDNEIDTEDARKILLYCVGQNQI